jgi:2-polyprenyl-3-methyl-5-hydroxy-6-metoxy-1,4-benzoquinol methylase
MKPLLVLTNPPSDDVVDANRPSFVRSVWRRVTPQTLRERIYRLRRDYRVSREKASVVRLPVERLLMGDQGGLPANQYAQLVGDWLYPSTPIALSPHVALLRDYDAHGDEVFSERFLPTTGYYQLCADCIRVTGQYRGATRLPELERVARRFVDDFCALKKRAASEQPIESEKPLEVRRIAHSDYYQIVEGHHRAAMACRLGSPTISAIVVERPLLTPLQAVLLSGSWLQGRFELYQPVEAPELKKKWDVVRKCTDRLAKMKKYLDAGSAYGWFLKQMTNLGFSAYGTDRDVAAAVVGTIAYGIDPARIAVEDLLYFLRRQETPYDVVSNMSVLHHYAMADRGVSPEEVISLLDRVTRHVLFFEMGEEHEAWYRTSLQGWNADFIEAWLRKNTSFKSIERLGPDEDAVPPFEHNYRRMLFACRR